MWTASHPGLLFRGVQRDLSLSLKGACLNAEDIAKKALNMGTEEPQGPEQAAAEAEPAVVANILQGSGWSCNPNACLRQGCSHHFQWFCTVMLLQKTSTFARDFWDMRAVAQTLVLCMLQLTAFFKIVKRC